VILQFLKTDTELMAFVDDHFGVWTDEWVQCNIREYEKRYSEVALANLSTSGLETLGSDAASACFDHFGG